MNPSPFRNPDGTFTDDAKEGRRIFQRAGCPTCHTGADFTDSPLGSLHDVGTILPTSGKRLGAPLTGFDVPTLKGVRENAPYLHDGRAATLKEIFVKYNPRDQLGHTSSLSDRELDELVAYLEQLDDVPEGGPLRGRGRAILGAVAACGLGGVVVGLLARLRQRRRSRPDRS